jgi:hypothetical protein
MRLAKTTLALALGLIVALPGVGIADTSAVGSSELDAALASSMLQQDAAREQVRQLLAREDVQKLAEASGLDLRRADAAVAALDGEELQEAARLAAQADQELAGGAQTITISLVAALLIVIIIILLVD